MSIRFGVGQRLRGGRFLGVSTGVSSKSAGHMGILLVGGCIAAIAWTLDWMKANPVLAVIIGGSFFIGLIIMYAQRARDRALAEEVGAVRPLWDRFLKCVEMVNHGKTTAGRVNNARKAVELIEQMQQFPKGLAAFTGDIEEHKQTLVAFERAYPFVAKVDKADEYDFKGNESGVKRVLAEALYHAQKCGLTDEELSVIEATNDDGTPVTIGGVRDRAVAAGWIEPA